MVADKEVSGTWAEQLEAAEQAAKVDEYVHYIPQHRAVALAAETWLIGWMAAWMINSVCDFCQRKFSEPTKALRLKLHMQRAFGAM